MGSQLSTRRTYEEERNLTKQSLKSKIGKVFRLGFSSDIKRERKERRHGRHSSNSAPSDAYISRHYSDQELPPKLLYQYHSDRSNRHSSRHGTARRSSSTSQSTAPVSNPHQSGSRGRSRNHSLELGPSTVYPHPQAVMPSYADRSAHNANPGPPVYPQVALIPRSSKSARSGAQPAAQSDSSTAVRSFTQPGRSDPSQRRHPRREPSRQSSNLPHDGPAYRSATTHDYVAPDGNQPGIMTIPNHTEYPSHSGQRPVLPVPPVSPVPQIPTFQTPPPVHSRHPKPAPQTWEIWKPPAPQQGENTNSATHRAHHPGERASRGPSASNQPLPVTLLQDRRREGGDSRSGGESSKSHHPSSSREDNSDDRSRRYDRRLGEIAAERRAPKSSKGRSVSVEAPASTTSAPMMFYRPGDPNHPSFKPISPEFKRRHYVLGGTSG